MNKRFVSQAGTLVVVFLLAASLQAFAFSEPSSPPPAGDVNPPVNVGSTAQTKAGDFSVSNGSAILNGDIVTGGIASFGQIGIGTNNPAGNLDVENGNNTAKICLNGSGPSNCISQWPTGGSVGPVASAGSYYDSGWFNVTCGNTYTITHNLNSMAVGVTVYGRPNASVNPIIVNDYLEYWFGTTNSYGTGMEVTNIKPNSVDIKADPYGGGYRSLWGSADGGGVCVGQYRVIVTNLTAPSGVVSASNQPVSTGLYGFCSADGNQTFAPAFRSSAISLNGGCTCPSGYSLVGFYNSGDQVTMCYKN